MYGRGLCSSGVCIVGLFIAALLYGGFQTISSLALARLGRAAEPITIVCIAPHYHFESSTIVHIGSHIPLVTNNIETT